MQNMMLSMKANMQGPQVNAIMPEVHTIMPMPEVHATIHEVPPNEEQPLSV